MKFSCKFIFNLMLFRQKLYNFFTVFFIKIIKSMNNQIVIYFNSCHRLIAWRYTIYKNFRF